MQFSDTSTNLGLYQDAQFLTGTDTNSFTAANFTRSANRWYYKAVIEAWKHQSDWEFDDTNQTNFPIATTTLVNSQPDYSIPSEALRIKRVEVRDGNGDYKIVTPIDETQISVALDEFHSTDGLPLFYRLVKNSIILYPAPDNGVSVTLASGLKLYFLREVDEFTASDTTQEPGIAEPFHRILSLGAAYDFALAKGKENMNALRGELEILLNDLRAFYAQRHDDFDTIIRPRVESYN